MANCKTVQALNGCSALKICHSHCFSCTVQTQPLVKHQSSGDLWLWLLWTHEMGNVYKNGHLYPGSQFCGQCKECKIFHWHTVPKDLNISDTVTSTITCSNTLFLYNTQLCSIPGAWAHYRPAHITALHQ